jgi:hypothetical protein
LEGIRFLSLIQPLLLTRSFASRAVVIGGAVTFTAAGGAFAGGCFSFVPGGGDAFCLQLGFIRILPVVLCFVVC